MPWSSNLGLGYMRLLWNDGDGCNASGTDDWNQRGDYRVDNRILEKHNDLFKKHNNHLFLWWYPDALRTMRRDWVDWSNSLCVWSNLHFIERLLLSVLGLVRCLNRMVNSSEGAQKESLFHIHTSSTPFSFGSAELESFRARGAGGGRTMGRLRRPSLSF